MSTYKFGFVLKEANDYLRKADLSYMEFIKDDHHKDLKFSFESDGILYIEEDVNAPKSDKLVNLLKDNNVECYHINAVKWKRFPALA